MNPNPTISSWLGTNVNVDLPRVDITYALSPFTAPSASGDGGVSALDSNGYPVAGVSGTSSTRTLAMSSRPAHTTCRTWARACSPSPESESSAARGRRSNGEQRSTIQITGTPGSFGNFLTLTITNAPGQTVTGIHVLMPGFDYDTPTIFLPQFISMLGPFRAMRFMDWMATNGSTLANWADRPAAAHFGHSPYGEPYEHIVELVNETGKDSGSTSPSTRRPTSSQSFADFCAANLDFDAHPGGAARRRALRRPSSSSSRTATRRGTRVSPPMRRSSRPRTPTRRATRARSPGPSVHVDVGKHGPDEGRPVRGRSARADRATFRTELAAAGHAEHRRARSSRAGRSAPAYSDEGLSFIKANYGDPKSNYVTYVAMAPYFAARRRIDGGALDTLFTALDANIAAMDATLPGLREARRASTASRLRPTRGASRSPARRTSPSSTSPSTTSACTRPTRRTSPSGRKTSATSLFMHFNLAGDPGLPESIYQYGYWGSIIGVLEDPATCEPNLPMLTGTESDRLGRPPLPEVPRARRGCAGAVRPALLAGEHAVRVRDLRRRLAGTG